MLGLFNGCLAIGVIGIVSLLAWGLGYPGQPHILARFMAIRSAEEMPVARRVAMGWVLVAATHLSDVEWHGLRFAGKRQLQASDRLSEQVDSQAQDTGEAQPERDP